MDSVVSILHSPFSIFLPLEMWAMRHFVLRLIVCAVGMLIVPSLVEGVEVKMFKAAFLTVALISVLNALVRPALFVVKIVTFPINLLTLGLFGLILSWVVNVLIFLIVGQSGWIDGFKVDGFNAALLGAFALAVINAIATMLIGGNKKEAER